MKVIGVCHLLPGHVHATAPGWIECHLQLGDPPADILDDVATKSTLVAPQCLCGLAPGPSNVILHLAPCPATRAVVGPFFLLLLPQGLSTCCAICHRCPHSLLTCTQLLFILHIYTLSCPLHPVPLCFFFFFFILYPCNSTNFVTSPYGVWGRGFQGPRLPYLPERTLPPSSTLAVGPQHPL